MKSLFEKPWWPQVRAVLILFHVLAITAGSIPVIVDERAMTEEAWEDPIAQEEFERWSERLQGWGFDASAYDVERTAWEVASGVLKFQSAAKAPFEPYYEFFGTRQRWRMFPAAVKNPMRLRIDIQINYEDEGSHRTIYLMGSKDRNWLGKYFNRDRLRAAMNLYAWKQNPEARAEFELWVARRAAEDFPEAIAMLIGFEIVPVLERDQASKGEEAKPRPFAEIAKEFDLGYIRKN